MPKNLRASPHTHTCTQIEQTKSNSTTNKPTIDPANKTSKRKVKPHKVSTSQVSLRPPARLRKTICQSVAMLSSTSSSSRSGGGHARVQIAALCSLPAAEDELGGGSPASAAAKAWQVQQAVYADRFAPGFATQDDEYHQYPATDATTVFQSPAPPPVNSRSFRFRPYEPPVPPLAAQTGSAQLQYSGQQQQQVFPPALSSSSSSSSSSKERSSRMSNSARGKLYRTRRKKYTDGLGDYVESLRQEIEDLQLYRRTQRETLLRSSRSLDATSSFARIVCEYFSLFEFGVPVLTSLDASHVTRDALVRSSRQAGFLNSMLSPDILFGGTRGVQLLLEQWERYSMYHTKLQFVLQTLDVVVADGENPVISAKAVLRVRFSRLTIQKVFPHVLWNEALVQRLIGLEIDYPVGNTFYFGADGKIHGYETEVDFIYAFTKALGSIQDSVELVSHALIKQQHMIGAEDDEQVLARHQQEQEREQARQQRVVDANVDTFAAPYQQPRKDGGYSYSVTPVYTDFSSQSF